MSILSKIRLKRNHIINFIIIIVVVYVAIATLNVIARNYQLQQQMDELIAENEILELENEQLRLEIAYFQTDSFVEKEARAKLNLQAPGEHTVIFSDLIPGPVEPPEPEPEQTFVEAADENIREWLYFLFRIDL
ncbi:MAG: cell division protein FtsL [Candidatus Saccharimonadales bacterium]